MNRDEEDILPRRLKADLHGLVPGLPEAPQHRDRDLLALAHAELGRPAGRWRRALWGVGGSLAAAAALLIAITLWQTQQPEIATAPLAVAQQDRPTIIDAMIAARRGAKPAEVDQIAMAAVRLDGEVR